jgi:hypothetical protein
MIMGTASSSRRSSWCCCRRRCHAASIDALLEHATALFEARADCRPLPGACSLLHQRHRLQLGAGARFQIETAASLDWPRLAGCWVAVQRACADRIRLQLRGAAPLQQREFGSHHHDLAVGSIGLTDARALDANKVNDWLSYLLQSRGADILRMKGVLNLKGENRRYVFHGVHMVFDGQLERPWSADAPRRSRLVFHRPQSRSPASSRPASNPASHERTRPDGCGPAAHRARRLPGRCRLVGRRQDAAGRPAARAAAAAAAGRRPAAAGHRPTRRRRAGGGWQKAGRLFASSGQDGMVLLWDARTLAVHAESTAGRNGASSWRSPTTAGCWRWPPGARCSCSISRAGTAASALPDHAGAIAALAWRPKSDRDRRRGQWRRAHPSARTQAESRDFPWRGACLTASWNADGRLLAAGMQDGSVHLWNVASGDESEMPGYWGPRCSRPAGAPTDDFWRRGRRPALLVVWDFGGKGADAVAADRATRRTPSASRRSRSAPAAAGWYRRRATGGCCYGASAAASEPQDAHLLADDCTLLRFSRDGARLAVGDARGGLTIYDCTP